jgi:hypothetical protein
MPRFIWVGLICACGLAAQQMKTLQTIDGISIFGPGSPGFSAIVNNLGATNTLAALGPGAELFVAIRNDSAETVESMRVLFETSGQKPIQWISLRQTTFAPGSVMLVAPDVLDRIAASPSPHDGPSIGQGGPATVPPPLAFLNGETTVSVDSVTFANGLFEGEDKAAFYDLLIETDEAAKSFFSGLLAMKERTDSEVTSMLQSQRSLVKTSRRNRKDLSSLNVVPAMEVSRLSMTALVRLRSQGAAGLMTWAEAEISRIAAKPILHRTLK